MDNGRLHPFLGARVIRLFARFISSFVLMCALPLWGAVTVSLSPSTATVKQGATQQFTATVSGTTNKGVTWTLVPATGAGTVSTSGLYKAPIVAGNFKVRATSKANTSVYAEATVTVPEVTVSVSPSTVTLAQGTKQTFVATVTGAASTGVTWTASGGTITSGGVYTAPSTAGVYTVTAKSTTNTARTATATVTVPMKISVSPATASLNQGATQTFTATVTGSTNKTVNWSVSPGGGSITSAGVYSATGAPGTYTVTATTVATPAASATASVTIKGVVVTVSPAAPMVAINGTQAFTATVTGTTNTAVTWTSTAGSITGGGVFTAPGTIGSCTVTATSVADPSRSASATVAVIPLVTVSIESNPVWQGAPDYCTATVEGAADTSVTWSASKGTIDANGMFTAPNSAGNVTITATSVADPRAKGTGIVSVSAVTVRISPASPSDFAGADLLFDGIVEGTLNPGVTWSLVSGTGTLVDQGIGPDAIPHALYKTPFNAETAKVKATSLADPTKSTTATVTVWANPSPRIRSFSAMPDRINLGESTTLTGDFGNGTGVVEPGSTPIVRGQNLTKQPTSSTVYQLKVTGTDGSTVTEKAMVGVRAPGRIRPAGTNPETQWDAGRPALVLERGGTVLFAGAYPGVGLAPNRVDRFDPSTGQWSTLGNLLDPKLENASYTLSADGKLWCLGGQQRFSGGYYYAFATVFDPSTGQATELTWSANPFGGSSANFALLGHSATLLQDGRILLCGGTGLAPGQSYGYPTPRSEAYIWDPITRFAARTAGDLHSPMGSNSTLMLADGKVLVCGGVNVDSEIFDPTLGTFSVLTGLRGQAVARVDGKVLFIQSGSSPQTSCTLWDPGSGMTTALGPVADFGYGSPALMPDGRFFIPGLESTHGAILDPTDGTRWTPTDDGGYTGYFLRGNPMLLPDGNALFIVQVSGEEPQARRFETEATLKVAPATAMQNAGLPVQFTAQGAAVTWTASGGGIAADGTFTSNQPGNFRVTATSGGGLQSHAWVRVYPEVQVSIQNAIYAGGKGILNVGVPYTYKATVRNHPDQRVTWQVQEGPAAGSVDTGGTFIGAAAGQCHLVATSVADPSRSATFMVTVSPAISLSINPASLSLAIGDTATFTAQEPSGQTSVTWFVDGIQMYSNPSLAYTAPMIPGTYTVKAVSNADPTASATAVVTVLPIDSFTITPNSASVLILQSYQFKAFATSALGTKEFTDKVTWSGTGGTFSEYYKGQFTAGSAAGSYSVQALLPGAATAVATIQVLPIDSIRLNPSRIVLGTNETIYLQPLITTANGTQICPLPVTYTCTGGSLSGGSYQTPGTPGTFLVQATVVGTTVTATSKIMVVTPDAFTTNEGGSQVLRNGFTSTRLLDGRVLIAGGGNASAELYDPATKTFQAVTGAMAQARTNHAATLLPDGKVFLSGGETTGTAPVPAELFDPATQTFTPTSGTPLFKRSQYTAVLRPDGKVLLAGGIDGFVSKSIEVFDPVTGFFAPAGTLLNPNGFGGAALLLADGRVLFAAPPPSTGPDPSEAYDFRSGTSTALAGMNHNQYFFSFIQAADGRAWALGKSSSNFDNSMRTEWFNPTSNLFFPGPVLTLQGLSGYGAAEQVDGSVYLFNRNGTNSYQFYPDSGTCDIARNLLPTDPATAGEKPVLLPTGELLRIGGSTLQGSTLILSDTTPNLMVLPRRISLLAGRSWPFQASSTGLGAAGFNWTVQEGAAGGTVSAQGVYTAPFTAGSYHVVATSKANGTLQAIARIDVVQGVEVAVTPALVQVAPSGQLHFSASVVGTANIGVTWSASTGTIAADGSFTAPASEGVVTVTATSLADPARSASATVVVKAGGGSGGGTGGGGGGSLPPPFLLSFTADTQVVLAGRPALLSWNVVGAYQLTLYAGGIPQDVTGRTSIEVRPTATTNYVLTVRNSAGTLSSPTLTITVSTVPVSIGITPSTVSLYTRQPMKFGWSLTAPTGRKVWTATAGSIDQEGNYIAPAAPGTATVTVTSVDDPGKSASAAVTVVSPRLYIQPKSMMLKVGDSIRFGYSWDWAWGEGVVWTATPSNLGTLAADGTFTATAVGRVVITIACASDPKITDGATLDIVNPSLQVLPSMTYLRVGDSFTFHASPSSPLPAWRVVEPAGGTIDSNGTYTTPATTGTFHVEASVSGRTAQAKVVVLAAGGGGGGVSTGTGTGGVCLSLSPAVADIDAGTYLSFTADVSGSDNPTVNWSIRDNPPEAMVDSQGVFRASRPGTYVVTATSAADPTAVAEAQILVRSSLTPTANQPPGDGAWWGYSVTPLSNGKILLAGGTRLMAERPENQAYDASAYLFDPETKTYTPTGNLLTARGWHHAVPLDDGRVLIAGGIARWVDNWSPRYDPGPPPKEVRNAFPFAEVYNPATGTFQALPSQKWPDVKTYNGVSLTSVCGPMEGPGMMRSNHPAGSVMKLSDGRILIGGGNEGWVTFLGKMVDPGWSGSVDSGEGWDVFNPTSGKFDLDWQNQTWSRIGVTAEMWPSPTMRLGMGTKGPTAPLADGKLMIGAGAFPIEAMYGHVGSNALTLRNGHWTYKFDPAAMAVVEHLPTPAGRPARAAATFTALSDGRILSVGGWDLGVAYDCTPSTEGVYYATSSQADLYDPATNTWTPVGSMARDRVEHAAVLLPTGQVMIVGGYKINADGTWELAETVELFDPDTKTFTTKERLDYGILDPKIAMQQDGGQFISGLLMDLRPTGMPALEGSSTASGSRRLPADLRPTGDTHAWIEKLHRLKREQPERFVGNSIGGLLFTIPGSAMLQTAAGDIRVTLLSMNQGVERILNATNTESGATETGKLAFKPNVPGVAYRPTRLRAIVRSNLGIAKDIARNLEAKITLVDTSGNEVFPTTAPIQADMVFLGWFRTNRHDFSFERQYLWNMVRPGHKIRVVLDPERRVLSPSVPLSNTTQEFDPKWVESDPMTVNLFKVSYINSGTTTPIELTNTELATLRDMMEERVKALFPVSYNKLTVLGYPAINVVWDENTVDPMAVNPYPASLIDHADTSGTRNGWGLLVGGTRNVARIQFAANIGSLNPERPANMYFISVFPQIPGHTVAANGDGVQGVTIINPGDYNEHFATCHTNNIVWALEELGHELSAQHTGLGTLRCIDPDFPYSNGKIGTPGWDAWASTQDLSQSTPDIMGYTNSIEWVSDYNYLIWWKHQKNWTNFPRVQR